MSFTSKVSRIVDMVNNPDIYFCQSKHLILFSHMRSRSSVFSHILGSNKGIMGYGELQKSYINFRDILVIRKELKENLLSSICNKYLYDKLLHSNLEVDSKYKNNENFRFILMTREPISTINSIIIMGKKTGNKNYQSPSWAIKYYEERLGDLIEYSRELKGRYFYIESEELLGSTSEVLESLTHWLALNEALIPQYKVFDKTGEAGHGDVSENIKLGKLIRTKPKSNLDLSNRELTRLSDLYKNAVIELTNNSLNN